MTSLFTCTACATTFQDAESQKSHYKLDWHRHNLRRKVAGLAPIDQADFDRRLAAAMGSNAPKPEFEGRCKECRKSFRSEGLYKQHLQSKKHADAVKKAAASAKPNTTAPVPVDTSSLSSLRAPIDATGGGGAIDPNPAHVAALGTTAHLPVHGEASGVPRSSGGGNSLHETTMTAGSEAAEVQHPRVEEEEGGEEGSEVVTPPMGPTVCIFCDLESKDFEEKCAHMLRDHGLFIPDVEYLVDPQGLVGYLEEKVKLGLLCLYCNGKGKAFHSYRAVQQHMMDRSHCKLLYEEGEDLHEYEAFYDFSASYTEAERQDLVKASSRVGGGTQDMSDESDSDEGDDSIEVSRTMSVNDLGELVLLDGKTVGNRQWNRYYRQHLKTPDESEFAVAHRRATQLQLGALYEGDSTKGSSTGGAVALHRGQRKAYGGLAGVSSRKDVKMLRAHQRAEARETLKTGVRQNKLNRTFTRVADM